MSASYARVASSEQQQQQQQPETSSRSLTDRWNDKLWAAAWVTAALLVAHWTSAWNVLLHDTRANQHLLSLAWVCVGVNTVLLGYLTLYLPKVKGLDASAWEVYCPRVIPCMTLVGVVACCFFVRGCWPVWGFLSPLILGSQAMGLLFGLHFVPWRC